MNIRRPLYSTPGLLGDEYPLLGLHLEPEELKIIIESQSRAALDLIREFDLPLPVRYD